MLPVACGTPFSFRPSVSLFLSFFPSFLSYFTAYAVVYKPIYKGQYVFDFRNTSFQEWFVGHYIINDATILHKPIPIGVGWLDDLMTINGLVKHAALPVNV